MIARGAGAVLLAAAALNTAAAAPAAVPPHTNPTRDVEVSYDLNDHGKVLTQHSFWHAATAQQRVDIHGGDGTWLLEDGKYLTAAVVDDAKKTVIDAKIRPGPLNGGPGSFKRLQAMTVAGVTCTEWDIRAPDSAAAPQQVCLTDDGVPLNLRSGMRQLARATSVAYRPADPALFAIPVGYDHIQR